MSRGPFRRTYPPAGVMLLDGGLNSKFTRSIIADNESPDCLNVAFTNGGVETRGGTAKLNTTAIGSFAGDGLYTRRTNTGSETMVAWGGGHMFALAGTTFTTVPSAQGVYTAGNRVCSEQAENYIFFGASGSVPYKWNGTEFTRHGVYPPTTTFATLGTAGIASSAGGVLNGDYRYKFTAVNSASVESDVGAALATFAAANATLSATAPTYVASFGINTINIYRNKTAASTTYFFVKATAPGATFTDNTADSGLGDEAPEDAGVPPNYSAVCYAQGRLFFVDPANPNYLWYSELNNPYTVASTNFVRIGDKSGEPLKCIEYYNQAITCYTESGQAWIVYMPDTDPANWQPFQSKSAYGSKSPFCVLNYNNKQLFAAVQGTKFVGFAALEGGGTSTTASVLTVSTAGSDRISDRIETDMFNIAPAAISGITGIVYKNKAYITVPYGTSQTTNNRVYVMDFSSSNLKKNQTESWVPWSGISANQFTIYDGQLYYITSAATGFVYKMEQTAANDDGSAINSYFWTKDYGGAQGDEDAHKDFRDATFLVDNSGAYYMTFAYRVDSDTGDGNPVQVSLNPGGSVWGTMIWGVDSWGGGTTSREVRQTLGTARGRRIQFKFSNQNTVNQKFRIHWLKFSYNKKGFR